MTRAPPLLPRDPTETRTLRIPPRPLIKGAELWVRREPTLKLPILLIAEQYGDLPGECGRFDQLHSISIIRHWRIAVKARKVVRQIPLGCGRTSDVAQAFSGAAPPNLNSVGPPARTHRACRRAFVAVFPVFRVCSTGVPT